jgi:hypothetical protein
MPQLQVHQAPDTIGVVALLFAMFGEDAVERFGLEESAGDTSIAG